MEIQKLLPLTEDDIKAVGNSRVNKSEGNKQIYWIAGAMIVMCAGVFAYKVNQITGWAFLIVGAVGAIYYMDKLSKKQKEVRENLLKQWRGQAK